MTYGSDFIAEKNKETNRPIWLYRINVSDDPQVPDLYFAENITSVSFFETNDGVDTARTYTAFPISHGGVNQNSDGRVDQVSVSIGNVSRVIQEYVESNNGLRGRKVTIRQVFANCLTNPNNYIEDIFYIDSIPSATEKTIEFTLTSKFDIVDLQLPGRVYQRNRCSWLYKGDGCFINGSAPTGFDTEKTALFTSKEIEKEDDNPTAKAKFSDVDLSGTNMSLDELVIDMKCTSPSNIGEDSYLRISSNKDGDGNYIQKNNLAVLDITSSWKTFTIKLDRFQNNSGTIRWDHVKYLAMYVNFIDNNEHKIYWRKAYIRRYTPWGFTLTNLDTCNHTLDDCRRHNNVRQFGGFIGVPGNGTIRL